MTNPEKYPKWSVLQDDDKHIIVREIGKHHSLYITSDRESQYTLCRLYDSTPQNLDHIDFETLLFYHPDAYDCIPAAKEFITQHFKGELEKMVQYFADVAQAFAEDGVI